MKQLCLIFGDNILVKILTYRILLLYCTNVDTFNLITVLHSFYLDFQPQYKSESILRLRERRHGVSWHKNIFPASKRTFRTKLPLRCIPAWLLFNFFDNW